SVKFIGSSGCLPLFDVGLSKDDGACRRHNNDSLNYLLSNNKITTIILIARWSVYEEGYTSDLGPAEREKEGEAWITTSFSKPTSLSGREELFSLQLKKTVDSIIRAGKTVVLVYPIPETGYDIPSVLAQMALTGRDPAAFNRPVEY